MKLLILWLCVMGVSMLIEMFSGTYVTMWFAIAGVFAIAVNLLGLEWYFQLGVFVVISVLLIFLVRNTFADFMETGKIVFRTPQQRVIGKKAVLTQDAQEDVVNVFIDGKLMAARAQEPEADLKKGTVVEVTAVEDGILLVQEATNVKEDHSLVESAARKKKTKQA